MKYKYLLICISILLLSFFANILCYSTIYTIGEFGYYDAFITFTVLAGPITDVSAVICAVLPVIKYENICIYDQINDKRFLHFLLRSVNEAIINSISFIIAHLISFMICIIFFHGDNSLYTIPTFGLFSVVRNNLPILYIFTFILHSFIFGIVMYLFAKGILFVSKNMKYSIFITIFIYFSHAFIPNMAGTFKFISDILYFVPFYIYQFLDFDISLLQKMVDLSIIFICAIIMFFYSYVNYHHKYKIERIPHQKLKFHNSKKV